MSQKECLNTISESSKLRGVPYDIRRSGARINNGDPVYSTTLDVPATQYDKDSIICYINERTVRREYWGPRRVPSGGSLNFGSKRMSMRACKNSVLKTARDRGVSVRTLVDTNTAFIGRVPVNGSSSYDFVTCSNPDGKRIVKRISN